MHIQTLKSFTLSKILGKKECKLLEMIQFGRRRIVKLVRRVSPLRGDLSIVTTKQHYIKDKH